MDVHTRQVLLLNVTFEPLATIVMSRAVLLVLAGVVDVVADTGELVRSPSLSLPAPSVVRLRRYAHTGVHRTASLTRRAVLARDAHTCAYCAAPATTVDHVHPRAKGGRDSWDNVVAACASCNNRKGDRTLVQLGWAQPTVLPAPTRQWFLQRRVAGRPDWAVWLTT